MSVSAVRPLAAQPLGARLAQQLRIEILSGKLRQDEHLVELQLAEAYGVSRGPVRDAIKELERDGLVYSARQGYRVAQLTSADVEEIYAIRLMVERTAIEATLGTGQSWERLEVLVEQMRAAAAKGDQDSYIRADIAFHRSFVETGGGKRLQAVWRLFEPTLTALFTINPHPVENMVGHAEEHAEICKSLQAGDDAWRGLLDAHLSRARRRFLAEHFNQA